MPRFRSRVVEIEAMKWTGYNYQESETFMEESEGRYEVAAPDRGNGWPEGPYSNSAKIITTLEGEMRCQPGDWIIKGLEGEFYPCKPSVFEKKYEAVLPL